MQMVYTRAVDAFQVYLNELLSSVFTTRPETLRSSEQISVQEVLEHQSLDAVISYLATRRVEKLSYESLRSVSKQLSQELSLELFDKAEDLEEAVRIFEARNLLVHNRGVINAIYVTRVRTDAGVGHELVIDGSVVLGSLRFLSDVCARADKRTAEKFGLPVEPLRKPPDVVERTLTQGEWPVSEGDLIDPETRS